VPSVRIVFRRRIRHPYFPALKPTSARAVKGACPALYGTFDDLTRAANIGVRVSRAVFPIRRATTPFLTDAQRDALWQMFQVPIYALLLDGRADVVGYECEAQDGIHIREDYAAGLLFARVESKLCECGRPGPRLMPADSAEENGSFEAQELESEPLKITALAQS
jgi:hypothetical protein